MSFDYAKMAATASRLIDKFGAEVVIARTTGGSTDPVTGVVTSGSTTTYRPKGLFQKVADALVDGTRIKHSDRMLILDDTVEPLMTDRPSFQGSTWTPIEILPKNPAGTPICYFVVMRK
jgi:hypothetical protein